MSCKMTNSTFVFVGDSFSLMEQEMQKIMQARGFQDAEINKYDYEEDGLSIVLEDVDTINFLASQKVVLLRYCHFLESNAKEDEQVLAYLEKYLDNQRDDVLFFLVANKLDERKKIVKTLRKKAQVMEISPELDSVLKNEFQTYHLETGVMPLLKDRLENAPIEEAIQECEKLKLYAIDTKEITKQDVIELVKEKEMDKDDLSFSLVRNIAEKNKKKALADYLQLQQLNLETFAIVGLLESQYRLLYQVLVLQKQHYRYDAMAKTLNVHPYRVRKTLEIAPLYQLEEVATFLKKLETLDENIKMGKVDSSMVLDLFILNL